MKPSRFVQADSDSRKYSATMTAKMKFSWPAPKTLLCIMVNAAVQS
jgi:hypothetical protein